MSTAFMTFYFLHILKTAIKENTSVRAENAAFCNYISTYADNKAVLSRTDKKIWSCNLSNKTCWNTIWCVSIQSPCLVLNSWVVGWVRLGLIQVQISKPSPKWCAWFTVIKGFCGTTKYFPDLVLEVFILLPQQVSFGVPILRSVLL